MKTYFKDLTLSFYYLVRVKIKLRTLRIKNVIINAWIKIEMIPDNSCETTLKSKRMLPGNIKAFIKKSANLCNGVAVIASNPLSNLLIITACRYIIRNVREK